MRIAKNSIAFSFEKNVVKDSESCKRHDEYKNIKIKFYIDDVECV